MINRRGLGLAVAVLALTGCAQEYDYEDAPVRDPDESVIFTNVDGHPNLVRVCIDGVAFATTSREYEPVLRVPEWDEHCAEVARQ
jgi:hypothetical protein